MARITKKSIDDVYNVLEIEEVINDYVDLKPRGSNRIGLCPFHNEKTPSFVVSPAKDIFKCFGCGQGGNAVHFLMEHNGISYVEALSYLADKYHIKLEYEEESLENKLQQLRTDELHVIMEQCKSYYGNTLFDTEEGKTVGLSYFRKRGFQDTIINTFGIGYAPSNGNALIDFLKKKHIKDEFLDDLGLRNKYGKDFFREKIIFPIHNTSGKVVAFAGRTLKGGQQPKYINSPETEIYNKSKILYGLFLAKTEIRRLQNVIVVEGYTDVMSLVQLGIKNVVATSGTALTSDHVRLLRRHTNKITLLFDSDSAGMKAAERASEHILPNGIELDIIPLPPNEDPDSFAQSRSKKKVEIYFENNAIDFILYKINLAQETENVDPRMKSELINNIIHSVSLLTDQIKQQLYVGILSESMGIAENTLLLELNKKLQEKKKLSAREEQKKNSRKQLEKLNAKEKNKIAISPHYYQEKEVVRILLEHGDKLVNFEGEEIYCTTLILHEIEDSIEDILYEPFKNIVKEYSKFHEKGVIIDSTYFVNHADPDIQKLCVNILIQPYEMSKNWVEKWDYPLQTQKTPEENQHDDVLYSIYLFKSVKIDIRLGKISEDIRKLAVSDYGEKEMKSLLKLHKKVQAMKQENAKKTGTVIFYKS